MKKRLIQSSVYPLSYDRNALDNPKKLTRNFNKWISWLYSEVYASEHGQAASKQLKKILA